MPITTRSGRKLVVVEEEEEDQGELESSKNGKGKRREVREASELAEDPSGKSIVQSPVVLLLTRPVVRRLSSRINKEEIKTKQEQS